MPREQPHSRLNAYHHTKQGILGNQAGRAAPAWKVNQQERRAAAGQTPAGSKILLSRLPHDVGEDEVQALFAKTVGPVQDAFIVYNSQGNSKGMAVVSFHRPGDAVVARQKYNGKIIDARRPIKIEIITDDDEAPRAAPPPPTKPAIPSLLERLGGPVAPAPPRPAQFAQPSKKASTPAKPAPQSLPAVPVNARRKAGRQKKGPKRVNKARAQVTAAQLDAEMESYRAAVSVEEDIKM